VGARAEPLTATVQHAERVPPAWPFDASAADAAASAGRRLSEEDRDLAAWVAGCTGVVPPRLRAAVVAAGDADGAPAERVDDVGGAGVPMPTVGHVARAVDEGRDRAGAARAAGETVLVIAGAGDAAVVARVVGWLTGSTPEPAVRGPLGALYRLGDEALAVLCGVALGAGEHQLALVCDGPAGTAAAALALIVQPALRPRLRTAGEPAAVDDPSRETSPDVAAALHAHLALPAAAAAGGVGEALAALRRACAQ
jgi:NaMN:DMB phosphoribosyltransferase